MADIYAAAHLTLIAAAGNNSHHGLPGVSESSRSYLGRAGGLRLYAIPVPTPSDYVVRSKWFKRGWTYQEGYFSPRRLIFLDYQMVYTCNSASHFEHIHFDQRQHHGIYSFIMRSCVRGMNIRSTPSNPPLHEPLFRLFDVLKEYSRRELTRQEDALNAIVGTLNSFQRDRIFHISGVPAQSFCAQENDSRDMQRVTDIALLWESWHGAVGNRRRHCFPSWSPIGWTGGVEWIYSRYIPPHAIMVHLDGIQALIDGNRYQDLSTIIAKHENPAPDRLKLETDALELKVVQDIAGDFQLALSIDEDKDLIFIPRWDIPLEERSPGQL